MSRIGKQPVIIPPKVQLTIKDGRVFVEGPKGKLQMPIPPHTSIKIEPDKAVVERDGEEASVKALHGLARALLNNMVKGVTDGFSKRLEIQGVGFKADVQENRVVMILGKSHQCIYPIPDQIKVTVEEGTKVIIEGPDRQVVGQVAAELRAFYPPEPYKGKGVRYAGERVERKEGKTVQ